MRLSSEDESLLSREELDALLEEMPRILADREDEEVASGPRLADVELQRANQEFALEHGLMLSNRHQRVVRIGLIGHREIELGELAEVMLPTDLAGTFQVLPKGQEGFVMLSRPFFFQLLGMSFGAGPTIKPIRPPVREYTRIERRFYERSVRELLPRLESVWSRVAPVELAWLGLAHRATVAEAAAERALLATFDVKGFSEPCRIRIAIPVEPFERSEQAPARPRSRPRNVQGVSVLEVPIQLRARVGTAELTLAEAGRLRPGQVIPLDAPSDGSLEIRIGGRTRFRGVPGTQGSRRAIQLTEQLEGAE